MAGGGIEGGARGPSWAVARHARDDVGEDEEEEQRVHADADDEGEELAAQDVEVAAEETEQRRGCRGRSLKEWWTWWWSFVTASVCNVRTRVWGPWISLSK